MSRDVATAPPDNDVIAGHEDRRRSSRRRGLAWLTIGLAITAGAATWYILSVRGTGTEAADQPTGPVVTAEVDRRTLTSTETWVGTLGHGTPLAVKAKGEGTVTGVIGYGSAVERGTELYRLDEQPVTALIGSLPMYRDLSAGAEGTDVRQLEKNLAALGYEGFTVDDAYTWYTAQAVEEWQDDISAEKTGIVGLDDVVFLAEGGRVDSVGVALGDTVTPGAQVLSVAGAEQFVGLDVPVRDSDLVPIDTEVTIGLPGGDEVAGAVTSAAVVEDTSGDDGGGGGDGGTGGDDAAGADDTTTRVLVELDEEVDDSLLGSPVDVVVDVETREDVLAVPVSALLALAEGGFGLEVVRPDGTTEIVQVEAGMFADGYVEVSGDDIDSGTVVGVAGG